jgi:hypothetical protein
MFHPFNLIQPQLAVLTNSNGLCYVQPSNLSSISMSFPIQAFLPQPVIPQNSFQFYPHQMFYPNQQSQNLTSINSSFKFKFFEILANQFPKVLKFYISQIIQSNLNLNFHFGKSNREIKRIPKNLLLKFIQEYSQIFFNLLNEETCISLIEKVFQQYIKIANQKKVRIQNFIQLYLLALSQFKTNSQLALIKSEITNLFSKI